MRGSIVKKGSNYYVVYDVGKKWDEVKEAWKRRQKWEAAGPRRKDAERLLARRLDEVHRGEYQDRPDILFRDFAEQWYTECVQGEDLKPSTRDFYRRNLDLHIFPVFGQQRLADIRLNDLQAFAGSKRKGASASTVNGIITTLTSVFKYATRTGVLRESPAIYIRRPKKQHREMDFLTIDEVKRLLDQIRPEHYALVLMAVLSGLRRGELLAAKWENVDWEAGQYFVRETLATVSQHGEAQFLEPKSQESRSSVDLTPRLITVLRNHRAIQAAQKLEAGTAYRDYGLVFCQRDGKPLDPANLIKREFYPALEAAKLRRIRFHDLRHTCASLLIAQGESPKYIQRQMRHASITTTLNIYGHLMPEVRDAAVERLDNALFGGV